VRGIARRFGVEGRIGTLTCRADGGLANGAAAARRVDGQVVRLRVGARSVEGQRCREIAGLRAGSRRQDQHEADNSGSGPREHATQSNGERSGGVNLQVDGGSACGFQTGRLNRLT